MNRPGLHQSNLIGANLPDYELNYSIAILIQEAIPEEKEESPSRRLDGEESDWLETKGRQSIQKRMAHPCASITLTNFFPVLEIIGGRHRALKKKNTQFARS